MRVPTRQRRRAEPPSLPNPPQTEHSPCVTLLHEQFELLRKDSPDAWSLLSALSMLSYAELRLPDKTQTYARLGSELDFVLSDQARLDKALGVLDSYRFATRRDRPAILDSCGSATRRGRTVILAQAMFTAVPEFIGPEARRDALDSATRFMSACFPRLHAHDYHMYTVWPTCDMLMPHLHGLRRAWRAELDSLNGGTFSPVPTELKSLMRMCRLLGEATAFCHEICDFEAVDALSNDVLAFVEAVPDPSSPDDVAADFKQGVTICALSRLANAAAMQCNVTEAMECNRKAYTMLREQKEPPILSIAGFEGEIGLNNDTAGFHDEALKWFERARDTAMLVDGYDATYKLNMARCLMFKGDLDVAEDMIDEALFEFRQREERPNQMIAFAFFVKASIQHRRGDIKYAAHLFLDAHRAWCKDRHGDLLTRTQEHPMAGACLYKIGMCLFEDGQKDQAAKFLEEALSVAALHAKTMPADAARCSRLLARVNGTEEKLRQQIADEEGKDVKDVSLRHESEYDAAVAVCWR